MNMRSADTAASLQTRNLIFIVLFNGLWALGNPFINISTTLATFFTNVQAPPYIFGLLSTLSHVPVLIQVLSRFCNLGSDSLRVPIYLVYCFTGVGYVLYGVFAINSQSNPGLFIPLMLAVYFLISCSNQLAIAMYLNYLTILFPAARLGRLYGFVGVSQAAASILGGFCIMPLVLNGFNFPRNYGLLFGLAGLIFLASTQFMLFTKAQPATSGNPPCRSLRAYLRQACKLLKYSNVKSFCLLMVLIQLGYVSYGFIWPMLHQQGMQSSAELLRTLTLVTYCSQMVLMPTIGWLADKVNHKISIATYMALVMTVNLLLVSRTAGNHVAIYVIYGMYNLFISMCIARVSSEIVVLEDRFDVIIIGNVIGVMAGAVVSVIYGATATITDSYIFIFIATAVFALLAIPTALRQNKNGTGIQEDFI